MQLEAWAPVCEAPSYDVSTWGRVRRRLGPDVLRSEYVEVATWPNHKGYVMVSLERAPGRPVLRYVHRLVLEAFRGRAAGRPIVNHDDGRKGHNALENLTWSTTRTNVLHGRRLRAEREFGQRSLLELLSA